MSMPRRMRRGSFCAHRVGKRLWSWLDPVQTGHAPAGSAASVSSTNRRSGSAWNGARKNGKLKASWSSSPSP